MNLRRWPLLPLSALYGAGLAVRDARYRRGTREVARLRWPVISVGNLSVGGAGKTPFTILLARALVERGWSVDVLSRGYGRSTGRAARVETARPDAARLFGDEPVLIASAAEVPVFVAAERAEAGRMAEASLDEGQHHVHVLDDGMQHRQLARDAEIVLLHRSDLTGALLPAGRLREPLAALRRADVVVLRAGDRDLQERVRSYMRPEAAVWFMRRELLVPTLPGAAVVFSAIARPAEFEQQLRAEGVVTGASRHWRDHHRFTRRDVEELIALARSHKAACFVTTEKDAVRLASEPRARLEQVAPVLTAPLRVVLEDEGVALSALEQRLRATQPA